MAARGSRRKPTRPRAPPPPPSAGPRGRRAARGKRRPAPAPPPPATAREELHRGTRLLEHRLERAAGLMERPDRGQIAAVLVRIRIANHHFLIAARSGERGDLR